MKDQRGFTLISVLIAIVVLSVGILSLTQVLATTSATHRYAGTRSNALAIARAHMEAVRRQPPTKIASEAPVQVNSEGEEDTAGPYKRSVDVVYDRHNLKRVTVIVDYPRSRRPVELVTLAYVNK